MRTEVATTTPKRKRCFDATRLIQTRLPGLRTGNQLVQQADVARTVSGPTLLGLGPRALKGLDPGPPPRLAKGNQSCNKPKQFLERKCLGPSFQGAWGPGLGAGASRALGRGLPGLGARVPNGLGPSETAAAEVGLEGSGHGIPPLPPPAPRMVQRNPADQNAKP